MKNVQYWVLQEKRNDLKPERIESPYAFITTKACEDPDKEEIRGSLRFALLWEN